MNALGISLCEECYPKKSALICHFLLTALIKYLALSVANSSKKNIHSALQYRKIILRDKNIHFDSDQSKRRNVIPYFWKILCLTIPHVIILTFRIFDQAALRAVCANYACLSASMSRKFRFSVMSSVQNEKFSAADICIVPAQSFNRYLRFAADS